MIPTFPLPIHRQAHRQHAHADFAHSIRRLATEEPAIDWRTDNDDSGSAALVQMWQAGLHTSIQAFWVHLLHQLEAFHWRILHARPPDRAAIVDEHIKPAVGGDGSSDQSPYAAEASNIHRYGRRPPSSFRDLASDGVDSRRGAVRIRREGRALGGIGRGLRRYDDCPQERLASHVND